MKKFLRCLHCYKNLDLSVGQIRCSDCQTVYKSEGGILHLLPPQGLDDPLTQQKWNDHYLHRQNPEDLVKAQQQYMDFYGQDTIDQISQFWKAKKDDLYLEIGCGPCFLGYQLAKQGVFVIGIDFSMQALYEAKALFTKGKIKNYLLIHGDINQLPIADNSINFIYGGGVIEHFRDTTKIVKELQRVLKPNCYAYNTVPYLNVGAFTYRQIWGHIPDLPLVRQLAEVVHLQLLKSKYLRFGYELSFSQKKLLAIHRQAGFKQIAVGLFEAKIMFEYLTIPLVRKIALKVVKSRLFWPVLYVAAKK